MVVNNEKVEKSEEIKKISVIVAVIVTGSLLIFFMNVVSALSPVPAFCGLCHSNEYKSLKKTAHRDISCNNCHRGPDFFAFAGYRIKVVRMTANYLTYFFYERPVKATVMSESCLTCHSDQMLKTSYIKGLRISHKEPLKAKYDCAFCHSRIAHGKYVTSATETTKNKCLFCHDNETADGTCRTCHPKNKKMIPAAFKGPWQLSHSRNWRALHGMGNLNTCDSCHEDTFCSDCHGITLPHDDAWLITHGPVAKGKRKICLSCHTEKLCRKCHQYEISHQSPSFLPQHKSLVKKYGKKGCLKCHLIEGCERCHSLHIHPGLDPGRLKKLKEKAKIVN